MNPFLPRRIHLTDADRAAWAVYEAEARAAAEQYQRLPISFQRYIASEPQPKYKPETDNKEIRP